MNDKNQIRIQLFMKFAIDLAELSKCTQRKVAAIVTDYNLTQIYSIGLNGGPQKGIDCLCELPGKETCIHAETQAISKNTSMDKDKIMFITLTPCVTCASLIVNNGFAKIYYKEDWKDKTGLDILISAGIQVYKIDKIRTLLKNIH